MKLSTLIYFLGVMLTLLSCTDDRIYDYHQNIDDHKWAVDNVLKYEITIEHPEDTFNIYSNIRFNSDYPYYNLWVKYFLYDSTGQEISSAFKGMDLFNPKTGKPAGSGFGQSFDYNILLLPKFKFPEKGKYNLHIKQYMRDNPLEGISSFGISVSKISSDEK